MKSEPKVWGIHANPPRSLARLLAAIPFIVVIAAYFYASHVRHQENAQDRVLPTFSAMVDATRQMAFERDRRSESFLMLDDTLASLQRLALGVGLAALAGLFTGLHMGLFPGLGTFSVPFLTFLSIVPPLSILPILFITFGVDELAKVVLIFIGLFPFIARDMYQAVKAIPSEQITKALTLGAGPFQLGYRIVLPQVMPRLLETVRLSLGSAWLYLIAAEAIASENGLGYRIFLVRRYLAMEVIIPYVLWITFLGFVLDWSMGQWLQKRYRWYVAGKK